MRGRPSVLVPAVELLLGRLPEQHDVALLGGLVHQSGRVCHSRARQAVAPNKIGAAKVEGALSA